MVDLRSGYINLNIWNKIQVRKYKDCKLNYIFIIITIKLQIYTEISFDPKFYQDSDERQIGPA